MIFQLPPEIDLKDYEWDKENNPGYSGVDMSRVSELLIFQIYCGRKYRWFNSFAVTDQIQFLENGLRPTATKHADSFRHLPLKGLYKKHWMDAHQLYRNTILELKENRVATDLDPRIKEFFGRNDGKMLDEGLIGEMVNIYTVGAFESRAQRSALTGHWLIYAIHNDQNYYMTIGAHDEGDDAIYERIKDVCFKEFGFLEAFFNDRT